MTTSRDALADALREAYYTGRGYFEDGSLADAVLSSSWLAEHDRHVEAEALRKAADHVDRDE